jgi:hypothetical protein
MNAANRVIAWRVVVQVWLWRHGWAWPAGAVAAALALGVHLALVQPAETALTAVRSDLALASADRERMSGDGRHTEQRDVQALQAVLRRSPPADELVRKMATLAQAEQIALVQSDYQQEFHGTTQVTQVRVTQPVRASYPQLRRYVESVLRTIPNASLDQVAARRDTVGQAQLEARLRWSLWIQASSDRPTPSAPGATTP